MYIVYSSSLLFNAAVSASWFGLVFTKANDNRSWSNETLTTPNARFPHAKSFYICT